MGVFLVSGKEAISPICVINEFFSNHIDFSQNCLVLVPPQKKRNTKRTMTKSQQPMS